MALNGSILVFLSEKLWGGNGEAICCFGEAIAYLHYNVSSWPWFDQKPIVRC